MQAAPAPPPIPVIPAVEAAPAASQSPVLVYKAYEAQRSELRDQLSHLQNTREQLRSEIREATGPDRLGLEQRLTQVDARIADLDKQIAAADQQVAKAAAIPGAVVPEPPRERQGPPEEVWVMGGLFMALVLFPLTIAWSRRLWKRSSAAVMSLPHELMDRMNRLDHAVDSIAVEVERIGEGQRFMTKVLSESGGRALGAGAAVPIEVPARGEAAAARAGAESRDR